MSNIALTLNFGSPAEAADLFEAIAHAFRTVAARTNAAVAAVTVAAGEAVQSFAPAPAPVFVTDPAVDLAPAAPAVVVEKAARTRKPREASPALAPEASVPSIPAATATAATATATPAAVTPAAVTPAAVTPAAVTPAAVAVAASPEPEKPGNITIDALRGMLKALMDRAEQVLGGGKGPLEALAIIAEFAPAGEKKISAIPAHLYGDAWDAIAKRTAALVAL